MMETRSICPVVVVRQVHGGERSRAELVVAPAPGLNGIACTEVSIERRSSAGWNIATGLDVPETQLATPRWGRS